MKKITTAILAFLYLIVTSGVPISFHYCMGKLRSIDLGYSQTERCRDCDMSTKKSTCCRDHIQWIKVDDNHKTANVDIAFQAPIVDLSHLASTQAIDSPPVVLLAKNNYHHPPIRSSQDLNILYCIFRI